MLCHLPHPTGDTRAMIAAAMQGLEAIYRPGPAYAKSSILLMGLCQKEQFTGDLFESGQSASSAKAMQVMDSINQRWGRNTLRPGRLITDPSWGMERQHLSPSYTTRLDQLWTVKA